MECRALREIRIASIIAARSQVDRKSFLASCLPAERSNAALIFDRCQEYDSEIKNKPAWTDDQISRAQAALHKIRTIQAVLKNDNCGYRDLAYRVSVDARLSAGQEKKISELDITNPTVEDAIKYLEEARNRDIDFLRSRYGLDEKQ